MKLFNANLGAIALLSLLVPHIAISAEDDAATLEAIKRTLHSRYEGLNIVDVRPAPVPGLYEVFTGDNIVYSDRTGDRLIVGHLVDTRTKRDLSADVIDERNVIDFSKLPLDRAIRFVKGNGKRRIAIFADSDCPYCGKLETELSSMNDITAYVFLYPLDDLHPEATARSRSIWCAPDRAKAWSDWMLKQTEPAAKSCASDPIAEIKTLGRSLRISSTPTLFLESGKRIAGALTAAQLETLLTAPPKPGVSKAAER